MLHAWVWLENPDFVFASEHRTLPYLRAGLPAEYADGASVDAANGIALLLDTQCRRERGILAKVARVEQRQAATLRQSCARAAATVRDAFDSRRPAADLRTARRVGAASLAAWAKLSEPERVAGGFGSAGTIGVGARYRRLGRRSRPRHDPLGAGGWEVSGSIETGP